MEKQPRGRRRTRCRDRPPTLLRSYLVSPAELLEIAGNFEVFRVLLAAASTILPRGKIGVTTKELVNVLVY